MSLRNLFGGTKCRTIDKTDLFGDSSGVALYRLDGNANDTGGNYHGTETVITYGGGVYERGAVFNGSSSVIANTSLTSMGTSNAVSFYINTASTTNQGFIEYSNGTNLIAIYHTSTTLAIRVNALLYTVTTTLPKSSFNHLVVSFATNVPTLYLNGTLQTLGSVGATAIAGTTGLRIGVANVTTVQTYTNGSIDQVRIFNRAITVTEVAILYAECAPASIVDNANPFEDNSLKVMYQFEGNANDLTGVYNGVVTGTPTYTTGKFAQGLVCAQTTSPYITTPALGDITSICAWVKFTTLPTANFVTLWAETPGTNTRTLVYYVSAGVYSIRSLFQKGANYYGGTHTINVSLTTGVWYHICTLLTADNKEVTYLNGTMIDSVTTTATAGTAVGTILIGKYTTSLTAYMLNGVIDQIRIFNKVLTPMEVASLYTETTPMEEPLAALVDPFKDGSGKALYRLEGNALDESGNYNGTATSVTYGNGISGRAGIFTSNNSRLVSTVPIRAISMWINRYTASANSSARLFYATSNHGAYLDANTNNILEQSAGTITKIKINNVLTNVITRDSLIHVYIELNATTSGTTYIGNHSTDTFQLGGVIDQVRAFNRSLTDAEITQLYTNLA